MINDEGGRREDEKEEEEGKRKSTRERGRAQLRRLCDIQ